MTKTCTSTQNDILRYIYNETSSSENAFIEESIASDSLNLDFYLDSIEIQDDLNKIKLCPTDRTIESILSFSKNFMQTSQSNI
jgi:hypothetical protein